MRQRQFLNVVPEAEAHATWDAATAHLAPRTETLSLRHALGRRLARDVHSPVDVPFFDRSNVDGFAVRAADTFGAEEFAPVRLELHAERLDAGTPPAQGFELAAGHAIAIATGGVIPRGADAVVMVEDTTVDEGRLVVQRAVAPGAWVSWAGGDLARGELVLRRGARLTSRDTGMAAAVGVAEVEVLARPRVGILSTGDEIIAPGEEMRVGAVYDSNGRILADAVRECGGEPVECGVLPDDEARLHSRIAGLLGDEEPVDVLLLSGGTSKGQGDLNGRVIRTLAEQLPDSPGVLVHGVALKPGKPICLSVIAGRPVVVLPGFPTSAIFTFHEFVAPLIRRLAGVVEGPVDTVRAELPLRVDSAIGRTEYCLANLVRGDRALAAYPLGAGSGSVSTFSRADGFFRIPHDVEYLPPGSEVEVRPVGDGLRAADLVAIGSHCVGLEHLLGELSADGFVVKSIPVGSSAGLRAMARGEGDVAGTHLLDGATGIYNEDFLPEGVRLLRGYGRRQGVVFRRGDPRFAGWEALPEQARRDVLTGDGVRMVNRNPGSGTRVLLDRLLGDRRPPGHATQVRSHHAVAAAVAQGRADWGVTLDVLALGAGLEFVFLQDERFDLAVPASRWDRPAVAALRRLLADETTLEALCALGFVR